MSQDYYRVLGLPRDATPDEVKRAFRQIARECHPDVAGEDPAAAERFKQAREAYEVLIDPEARARHDRRGTAPPGGRSFFHAFYEATGRNGPRTASPPGNPAADRSRTGSESLDLEDLFNDFGFGAGHVRARATGAAAAQAPRTPRAGEDVHLDLEVPASLARRGGSRTVEYRRLQRLDTWTPGSPHPGVLEVVDLAQVRILPGTEDGAVLREHGRGHAGVHGGPYGDLVVRIVLVDDGPEPAVEDAVEELVLDVTIAEAVLGARIELDTPGGRVRLGIPPGTSSGTRLRLPRKGRPGVSGEPSDLLVVTRIVVPRVLDDESRTLIERFAELNPQCPRGGSPRASPR